MIYYNLLYVYVIEKLYNRDEEEMIIYREMNNKKKKNYLYICIFFIYI